MIFYGLTYNNVEEVKINSFTCQLKMYMLIYLFSLAVLAAATPSPSPKVVPQSRLMLEFDWPEPDSNITKYPHEEYCDYYYFRESFNIYTVRKCLKGMSFDYHVHECKEKRSAQCWSDRYGKNKIHDHLQNKWRQHFKCPFSSGNFPDAFHCRKYFVCVDGQAQHEHCPAHEKFDKVQKQCVEQKHAFCATVADVAELEHTCPRSAGNFGHPKDCSKYYHCNKNKPNLMKCDINKLFDDSEKRCKNKEKVHCGQRYNPYGGEHDETKVKASTSPQSQTSLHPRSTPISPTESSKPEVEPCPANGPDCFTDKDGNVFRCPEANGFFHPEYVDKFTYIICKDFKILMGACPEQKIFDSKLNICIESTTPQPK